VEACGCEATVSDWELLGGGGGTEESIEAQLKDPQPGTGFTDFRVGAPVEVERVRSIGVFEDKGVFEDIFVELTCKQRVRG
jgi:hypothetical protein